MVGSLASKETRWRHVLQTLVCYRLIDPGSEWRLHRLWFEQSAMGDLLGADYGLVEIHALYRCLDKLLKHKRALFDDLRQRWQDLFGAEFEVLLGQYNRLPTLAADLIDHRVNIIVAAYLIAARAAEAATQTVPIVFITGSDPITAGLVSSLNRPTGNATGIAFMVTRLGEKNLATLHELVPNALVIGALVNPNNSNLEPQLRDLRAAASGLGLQIVALLAGDESEIDRAFARLAQHKIQALLVTADGFFFGLQDKLATLAARYAVPAFYPLSDYVLAGGLISYGANLAESWRQARAYVGKIVKGAKPSDLPVMQPAKFELVLNSKTPKPWGLRFHRKCSR